MATIEDYSLTELRRDLHAHPEAGWKEFRTTALVAEELGERGFTLHVGEDAVAADERLGVPPEDELRRARDRALDEGAPEKYVEEMGLVTGLVAENTYGDGNGPVVGLRVDLDALERTEATDDDHRPAREEFASKHTGEMHACGHDAHTAIGVGVARGMDVNGGFDGTLKLFFQPAEEGGRGGLAMSRTTHVEDIEYFIALHLGLGYETGTIVSGYERPLSNAKIDVDFHGESAHAGKAPNEGRNAAQALGAAIQNLYAIPRHEDGTTRINVGQVHSPNAQNVISDAASLRVEVRGGAAALNEYMLEEARRIVEHAAGMYDVEYETSLYGKTTTFEASQQMVDAVKTAAKSIDSATTVIGRDKASASEDASFLIERVQETDGVATYVGIGADTPAGHHTPRFDLDEDALEIGVDVVTTTVESL